MKQNSSILVLDSLRAFAAISVCLFHFVCTTTNFIQSEFIRSIFLWGMNGVHAFFVISGFIIPWAMFQAGYTFNNFFKFISKRIIRLEPPYLISLLLCIVVLYIRQNYYDKPTSSMDLSWTQVALHIGYLIPFFKQYHWLNPVYRTLLIEFQYYILMALVFVPLINSKIWVRLLTFAVIIIFTSTLNRNYLFYWLPVFSLGMVLFLFKAKIISAIEFVLVINTLIIYCFYYLPFSAVIYSCIPVFLILFYESIKIPMMDKFGRYSYSLYLVHPIVGSSIVNIFSHYCTQTIHKLALICLGFIVSIAGALAMFYLIEKPSKKLSSSIKYVK